MINFFQKIKLPHILLIIYIIVFTLLGIKPLSGREVWFAENLPILLIVLFLLITYKSFKFSNLSYILMSFLIFLHTIGGYYTFAAVPFDFITNLFGFERNHFDRMAHFTVGFYAYPIAEFLTKKKLTNSKVITYLFAIFAIMSLAGAYELFEWQFAIMSDSNAGIEVLGSQGDIWDAQKDILADTLGAIFAICIFHFNSKRKQIKSKSKMK
ncbi:MAG: DUF2238 domain-containing protein [Nanoarchaeota archaeon]|nr:DUF2238 domain-containing protein [Nanoarchaeota archaeon]